MKRTAIFLFTTMFTCTAFAQGMDKGHHIEFYGGASIPVGSFGKSLFGQSYYEDGKQSTLDFHGAKTGASYGLVADFYVINDYIGILINVNASTYSLKSAATYPANDILTNATWNTTASGKWHSIQVLLGATFRYPIVDWLLVTGRAAIGYNHLVVPFFASEATTQQSRYTYKHTLTTPSKGGFGYLAGVGLQFSATSSIGFHLRCDYTGSSAIAFRGNKQAESVITDDLGQVRSTDYFEFHESFQAINLNFGLSLAF
ncbi:MAG: hypothetical protein LBQ31_04185 [Bacteroidales bacterium]|jgi:hypothetical protein|nr:hypothetical protein [Bacteroidales bacterium]